MVSQGSGGLVDGEQDGRRPGEGRPVGAEPHRPDLGGLGRTAVVGLPQQVGIARGGVDERARVEHAPGPAVERSGRRVGEYRGTGLSEGAVATDRQLRPLSAGLGLTEAS